MIPENTITVSQYIGNDVAFQFPFYFRALKASDIKVFIDTNLGGVSEIPSGVIDGINNTFGLANNEYAKSEMKLYKNGLMVPDSDWNLYQSNVSTQMVFIPAAIPTLGSTLEMRYGIGLPTTLIQGIDYSFTFKSFPLLGGTITLIGAGQSWMNGAALKNAVKLTVQYVVSPSQISKLRDGGPFLPLEIEKALDKLAMDLTGLQEQGSNGSSSSSPDFPSLVGEANKIVTVNATEDGFTYGPIVQDILDAETNSAASAAAAQVSADAAQVSADNAAYSELVSNNNLAAMTLILGSVNASEANAAQKADDAAISADQALAAMNTAIAQVPLCEAQVALAEEEAFKAKIMVDKLVYEEAIELSFSDSPYDILVEDSGKIFRVDTSLGSVILNLPTRPAASPDFRVEIIKTDNSTNIFSVVPYGADTVGGLVVYMMSLPGYGTIITPGLFSDWQVGLIATGISNSGLPTLVTEKPLGLIDGINNIFAISQTSLTDSLILFVDGVKAYADEYSVLGNNISMVTPPELGQVLQVWYFVATPTSTGVKGKQEVPTGNIDGINGTFDLTDNPFNKPSMMLFKNGLYVDGADWAIFQTATGSQIVFNAGLEPVVGDKLSVFYLVNILQAISIVAPPPAPPSNDGALSVHGDRLSPVVLTPAGLTVLDERRALWYLKSNGGAMLMPGTQISPGFQVGDELIIVGVDQVDYPSFVDGQGIEVNGNFDLKAGAPGPGVFTTKKYLIFDGIVWSEVPMI